ncbi:MAG: IS481 family transposase [Gemmatimonadales bacterium]|nr:IS481 family transposase [Gemmatimonadales bacterium]
MPPQYNPQQMVWKRLRLFRRARQCRNVSQACREFGVSRKTYYKWRKRLKEAGGDTRALRDRSRRPHAHPRQATPAQQRLISRFYRRRRWRKHLVRLWWHLHTHHGLTLGVHGAYKVLKRAGLLAPQRRRRRKPKPYEAMSQPGERIQIDVKHTGRRDRWGRQLYQYTACDEYSRWRLLHLYQEITPQSSVDFFARVQAAFPFPIECIQTDHGTEFTYDFLPQATAPHPFTEYLQCQGVRHKLIRIATPWHNGKVERSHRTDEEEFWRLFQLRSVPEAHRRLARWNHRYNTDRPHGALGWKTPTQMLTHYKLSLADGVAYD